MVFFFKVFVRASCQCVSERKTADYQKVYFRQWDFALIAFTFAQSQCLTSEKSMVVCFTQTISGLGSSLNCSLLNLPYTYNLNVFWISLHHKNQVFNGQRHHKLKKKKCQYAVFMSELLTGQWCSDNRTEKSPSYASSVWIIWIKAKLTPVSKNPRTTDNACLIILIERRQLTDFLTELFKGSSLSLCFSGPPRWPRFLFCFFTRSSGSNASGKQAEPSVQSPHGVPGGGIGT